MRRFVIVAIGPNFIKQMNQTFASYHPLFPFLFWFVHQKIKKKFFFPRVVICPYHKKFSIKGSVNNLGEVEVSKHNGPVLKQYILRVG